MNDLRPLLAFAAPYRAVLAGCAVLMLLETVATLAVPWLGGRLADSLLNRAGSPGGGVQVVLVALIAAFAVQGLIRFANSFVLGTTAQRVVTDLKTRIYDHLQALPLAFFQERRQGDVLALLTHDVYTIGGFITGTALAIVPLLVTVSGAMFFMFRLQPVLASWAVVLIPLFYLLLKVLGRRIRPLATQLQQEQATTIAVADENLGMLPTIKMFTREALESRRFRQQAGRVLQLSTDQIRITAALGPAIQFVAALAIAVVLWYASEEIAGGTMTPAELVSFLLYAQLLSRPVAGLADIYGQVQATRGAMVRLIAALGQTPEPDPGVGENLAPVKGVIAFEGVTFSYPGRAPALRGVDLAVGAGETVAIVGPNGAGKSTVAHLLMRLHEPASGRITIDGVDIANVSLASLRGQIGVVPQYVLLFNASIRDNIGYGRIAPTEAQIEAAARAARAHDFIVALPSGYDTVIGDRGVRLSGGQQQRVALARALLKNPPILILDEATAMFDPDGEREFLEECRDVFQERTVLLITHRPASLAVADRIVRMEEGRVVRS